MYLAEKTVKNYVSNLLSKMGMERRTQAASYAARGKERSQQSRVPTPPGRDRALGSKGEGSAGRVVQHDAPGRELILDPGIDRISVCRIPLKSHSISEAPGQLDECHVVSHSRPGLRAPT